MGLTLSEILHYIKNREGKMMGERYVITGVQLGVITALLNGEEIKRAIKEIDSVYNHQYLGDSKYSLRKDITRLKNALHKDN